MALVVAKEAQKSKTTLTLADAAAIAAAEAIKSIGGPVFTVQLGRVDACRLLVCGEESAAGKYAGRR